MGKGKTIMGFCRTNIVVCSRANAEGERCIFGIGLFLRFLGALIGEEM